MRVALSGDRGLSGVVDDLKGGDHRLHWVKGAIETAGQAQGLGGLTMVRDGAFEASTVACALRGWLGSVRIRCPNTVGDADDLIGLAGGTTPLPLIPPGTKARPVTTI